MGAAVMPAQASNEAMMDLLKVLHQKGTISDTDYELLANAAKADKEAGDHVAMQVEKAAKKSPSFKALEWAERIKIKGDMRFRHETIRAENTGGSQVADEKEDRLRIRARIGVYADINESTKAGFRFVTTGKDGGLGSNDSTNESLDEEFKTRNLGIDLAYIDWAPQSLGGNTNFVFGKMKQPWTKVNSLVWDGDTNPEGIAVKSKFKVGGLTLIPSAGYYSLKDISTTSFSDETHLIHAQLAAKMGKKTKFGVSFYGYEDDTRAGTLADPVEERLVEVFGQTAIPGTPVTAYASFVDNQNDNGSGIQGDEEAWVVGAKAKMGSWKLGYEYRDHGINALNDNFNNSDTLDDGKGSIFKLGYKIDKNFSVGATYYDMESNISESNLGAGDIDDLRTLHLDLKAKF